MTKTLFLAAVLAAALPSHAADTLSFQQGLAGYTGTQDTMVRSADVNSSYGSEDYVSVDGDDGSPGLKPNHGLLRFDDLFGAAAGQIHAGDTIVSATLTLQVINPGSGMKVHDMLVSWSGSSTWNSLGNGVQTDGVEAATTPLWTGGLNDGAENIGTGALVIDVTSSLLAMQGGATLYGWAFIPFVNGTNGIDFNASEYLVLAERPLLSVQVSAVPEPQSIALMLAGLGLMGTSLRRRMRA